MTEINIEPEVQNMLESYEDLTGGTAEEAVNEALRRFLKEYEPEHGMPIEATVKDESGTRGCKVISSVCIEDDMYYRIFEGGMLYSVPANSVTFK